MPHLSAKEQWTIRSDPSTAVSTKIRDSSLPVSILPSCLLCLTDLVQVAFSVDGDMMSLFGQVDLFQVSCVAIEQPFFDHDAIRADGRPRTYIDFGRHIRR
jgi:hypothetical protein